MSQFTKNWWVLTKKYATVNTDLYRRFHIKKGLEVERLWILSVYVLSLLRYALPKYKAQAIKQ